MSAQPLEIRMAFLEGTIDQMNHRLDSMDRRLDGMDRRLDSIERGMDQRFTSLDQKIDKQFLWVVGLIVISIILPMAERFIPH